MGLTGLEVLGPNMETIPLSYNMLTVGRNFKSRVIASITYPSQAFTLSKTLATLAFTQLYWCCSYGVMFLLIPPKAQPSDLNDLPEYEDDDRTLDK